MERHVHRGLSNLIDGDVFYNDPSQISNLQSLSNPNQENKIFFKLHNILTPISSCQNGRLNPSRWKLL